MVELMKSNYKVEDLVVKNLSRKVRYNGLGYNFKEEVIYDIENELSEADKLVIVDSQTDGLGSYLIDLIKKYELAKSNGDIKKTSWGSLHKGSAASWMKKNDPRGILRQSYPETYPVYWLYGNKFRMDLMTPKTDYGYMMAWHDHSVINQWFHFMLKALEVEELAYYKENDKDQVNFNKLDELVDKYHNLLDYDTYKELYDIIDDRDNLDPTKVKEYLDLMTKLDKKIESDINSILVTTVK